MRQIKKKLRLALRRGAARRLGIDRDERIARSYLASAGTRKLQIGCGPRILPGWLNADYHPKTRDVLHLDATRRLPFADGVFDYVFSEHMIEHVAFAQGRKMIEECFRVLAPGGTVRISTPDLAFLIDLYRPDEVPARRRSPLQEEFLRHFLATEIEHRGRNAPEDYDTFLINKFVRAWGHEFLYDEKTLRYVLEASGFGEVTRCAVSESAHGDLRELENVSRKPEGHLGLESLVLEATKPGSPGAAPAGAPG
ncbi:MAG: methyltransferase domain-containing protein [Acidobacteriota bacterium]|nr:methyltransferase domain-containing protein [Acidobacteriota bacterium]MDH3522667.1 methyltransferase domain-containing protein [Acidobacteriota bacterium]